MTRDSTDGALRHADCRPDAPWMDTLVTHESWLSFYKMVHIIWSEEFGLSYANAIYDLMHCGCLGVLQYFLASVLVHILHDTVLVRGAMEKRRLFLWSALQSVYEDVLGTPHGERLPCAKFKIVVEKGCGREYPYLNCKAAHARHLLAALTHLVTKQLDLNAGAFRSVRLCLAKMDRFYNIRMAADHYIESHLLPEAKSCIDGFLVHQNLLNSSMRTAAKPRLLYGITIKSHLLQHIGFVLKYYNPRRWWNHADEDFVSKISGMAVRECQGRSMLTIPNAIASRYRLRLYLRHSIRNRKRQGIRIGDVGLSYACFRLCNFLLRWLPGGVYSQCDTLSGNENTCVLSIVIS